MHRGNYIRTEEHCQKMSKIVTGRKHSKETIEKFKKRRHTDQVKKSISDALKGRKDSKETIRKRANSNRGKKRSLEVLKKLSKAHTGIIPSKETRNKMSMITIKRNQDPNDRLGKRVGKIVEYKDIKMRSSWEIEFAKKLDILNISWVYEPKSFKVETKNQIRYTPDFCVKPKNNIELWFEIKPKHFHNEVILIKEVLLKKFGIDLLIVDIHQFDEFITAYCL